MRDILRSYKRKPNKNRGKGNKEPPKAQAKIHKKRKSRCPQSNSQLFLSKTIHNLLVEQMRKGDSVFRGQLQHLKNIRQEQKNCIAVQALIWTFQLVRPNLHQQLDNPKSKHLAAGLPFLLFLINTYFIGHRQIWMVRSLTSKSIQGGAIQLSGPSTIIHLVGHCSDGQGI